MTKTAQKVMVKRVVKKKVIVLKAMKEITMTNLMSTIMMSIMIQMIMEIMNLKVLAIVYLMRNKNTLAMVVVANIIRTVKVTMVDSHTLVKLIKTHSIKLS